MQHTDTRAQGKQTHALPSDTRNAKVVSQTRQRGKLVDDAFERHLAQFTCCEIYMTRQNGTRWMYAGMQARVLSEQHLWHTWPALRVSDIVGCELLLNIEMLRFIEFPSPIQSVRLILTVTSLHAPSPGTHLVLFHCRSVEISHLEVSSKMNELYSQHPGLWPYVKSIPS